MLIPLFDAFRADFLGRVKYKPISIHDYASCQSFANGRGIYRRILDHLLDRIEPSTASQPNIAYGQQLHITFASLLASYNRTSNIASGHRYPSSRGLAFFIDYLRRPKLVTFEEKVKVISQTKDKVEAVLCIGIMNSGRRPARDLHAQYEKVSKSGVIPPSWHFLFWELRDGTRTTKPTLGYREPAKLELFTYTTVRNPSQPNLIALEIDAAGQKSHYTYAEEDSEESTVNIANFRVGIYGEDDLEAHFMVHIFAHGPLLDVLTGPVPILPS